MKKKLSLILVLVVIFFCACDVIRGDDDGQCDPVVLSFRLCTADRMCRSRWFLEENKDDMDVFRFLHARMLANSDIQRTMPTKLCQHNNNTGARLCHQPPGTIDVDDLDDFYQLWILFMTKYRFCAHPNEYFDGFIRQCVCRQDRVCTTVHPIDMDFHFSNYELLVVVSLFAIGAIVFWFIKKTRQLLEHAKLLQHT